MTALKENSPNTTEDEPDVEVASVPAQEKDVADMDSVDFDCEVTGTFLRLTREMLNTEAEITVFSNSLGCTNFFSASHTSKKKKKKTLKKWNNSIETSQVLLESL